MQPVKAIRATVVFFRGLEVDGYRMPNGEFRVGAPDASRVVGYGRNWLTNVLRRGGSTYKALLGLGFSEKIQKVIARTKDGKFNPSEIPTISLKDFNRLICYAANDKEYNQNQQAAIALQLSLTELSLLDFFRDAFGEVPLTIDEKRTLFYKTYAASISPADWRKMDRQDILNLALAGDEEGTSYGLWNSWDDERSELDIDL